MSVRTWSFGGVIRTDKVLLRVATRDVNHESVCRVRIKWGCRKAANVRKCHKGVSADMDINVWHRHADGHFFAQLHLSQ